MFEGFIGELTGSTTSILYEDAKQKYNPLHSACFPNLIPKEISSLSFFGNFNPMYFTLRKF